MIDKSYIKIRYLSYVKFCSKLIKRAKEYYQESCYTATRWIGVTFRVETTVQFTLRRFLSQITDLIFDRVK